jgi:hypothetical protein
MSGTSTDFIIDLSQQISSQNNYDSACVLNFTCPKSYYLFTSGNNKFYVDENGAITEIVIPVGNYSFNTLPATLATQMNACAWNYTITSDTLLGKYQFAVTGNGGLQPTLDFTHPDSAHAVIGFDRAEYVFAANSLESPNIVNFQKTNTLELCCDFVKRNLLSVIIPNSTDFSFISYNEFNSAFVSQPVNKNVFSAAHFYLLDGTNGRTLDLNGLDFVFTFAIYKKNNYYAHMLEDRRRELQIKSLEEQLAAVERALNQPGGVS